MRSLLLFLVSAGMSFAQLQGVVDVHTHGDPDSSPRKIDVLEFAHLAKAAGMRAIVLKNHYTSTVQAAYLVGQLVPGIEVVGAIALDRAVGGVNPEAVRQAAAFKGKKLRIVWMPTFDSENEVTFLKQNRPFASVARNGQLLPETMEVLKIIAKEKSFWRPDIPPPPRLYCWSARRKSWAFRILSSRIRWRSLST